MIGLRKIYTSLRQLSGVRTTPIHVVPRYYSYDMYWGGPDPRLVSIFGMHSCFRRNSGKYTDFV